MKKVIGLALIAVALLAGMVQADSYTVTLICTGTATQVSAQLPVSGELDKIEYTKNGAVTTTLTVATFDNTTAIETYWSKAAAGAARGMARPRFVGTTYDGTALAAAVTYGNYVTNALGQPVSNYVATTTLSVPYGPALLGGNIKLTAANTQADLISTNVVTIFYKPLSR